MDYQAPPLAGFHSRPWGMTTPLDEHWTSHSEPLHRDALDMTQLDDRFAMHRYYQQLDHRSGLPWSSRQTAGTHATFNVPSVWQKQHEVDGGLDSELRHHSPACFSGPSSMYTSDSMSDRQSPPARSPHLTILPYSPEPAHREHLFFQSGVCNDDISYDLHGDSSCVAMEHVQRYADTQPEEATYEEDQSYDYQRQPQEGFIPMELDYDDSTPSIEEKPTIESTITSGQCHQQSTTCPVIRRRRAPSHRAAAFTQPSSRINKRGTNRRSTEHGTKASSGSSSSDAATTSRAFPCPFASYGCSAAFMAKNEWKRHVYTQHLRLGYWRCDQCSTEKSKKPNDFNRKDLFVQHVRRMHPVAETPVVVTTKRGRTAKPAKNDFVEEALSLTAERCHRSLRSPPADSCCFFCDQDFHGSGSFEERLEHIGKHMESAKKEGVSVVDSTKWNVDDETEQWLLEHGIIVQDGKRLTLADGRD